jgi:hypothetical protein
LHHSAAIEAVALKPSNPSRFDDSEEERELARAMQEYRRTSGRMFPTWCEVLEVLQSLGYAKLSA